MKLFSRIKKLNFFNNDSLNEWINFSLKHKKKMINVGLLTFASSSMFMLLPLGFKEIQILSKNNENKNINEVKNKYYIFGGKTILYLLLWGVITRTRLIKSKQFEDNVLMDIRRKLFMSKLLKKGKIYENLKYPSSTLITKNINDAYNITFSLSDTYIRMIRGLTFGVGGISIMIYSFPSLFIFTALGIIFLNKFNQILSNKIKHYSNLQIKKLAEKSSFMGSIYNKNKLIESNKLFEYSYTKYNKILKENHELTINLVKQKGNYLMLLELFGISFFMGIITYGSFLISIGKIPTETLSLTLYSIYGILGMRGIFASIADLKEKLGIYSDIKDLIKENDISNYDNYINLNNFDLLESLNSYIKELNKNNKEIEYENLLNLNLKEFDLIEEEIKKNEKIINKININIKYNIENKAKNINYEINKNEKIGVIGKSGVGKSSFFDIIKGLYNFEHTKKLEFYNENNELINENDINIFYCFQDDMLIHETIIENIILGNYDLINKLLLIQKENNLSKEIIIKFIIKKVLVSLKKVQIYDIVIKRNNGLLEIIEELGNNFSAGEKQRINLARLFLNKPDLILLDESTSNLDLFTESLILNEFKTLLDDRIILTISHNKDFINKFVDRKLFIE